MSPFIPHILAAVLASMLCVTGGLSADSTATIRPYFYKEYTNLGDGMFTVSVSGQSWQGTKVQLHGPVCLDTSVGSSGLKLTGLPPGNYLLVATMDPYAPESLRHDLGAGENWRPSVTFYSRRSRTLTGHVTDSNTGGG